MEVPAYTDAVARFRRFISKEGYDSTLHWLFREDIVDLGLRVFVRLPLPKSESLVECLYEEGIRRGLGIHLQVFCFLHQQPLCYIWLPKDEEDAEYRMLSGLKFSLPAGPERRTIVGIRSNMRWKWLRWRERRSSTPTWINDIPKREQLEERDRIGSRSRRISSSTPQYPPAVTPAGGFADSG